MWSSSAGRRGREYFSSRARWKLLRLAAAGAIVLIVLTWTARWWIGMDLICQFTFQWITVATLCGLALAWGRYWVWSVVTLAVTIPGWWQVLGLYAGGRPSSNAAQPLRILICNVYHENYEYKRLIELVREVRPDVMFLAEVDQTWQGALREVAQEYPHSAGDHRYWNTGTIILSRWPLEAPPPAQRLERMEYSPTAVATLRWGVHNVTLIGVHPKSPTSWERLHLRTRQFAQLERLVGQFTSPVIVAGDFNTTSWSPSFRRLVRKTGLRDSRRGFGIQPTWPAWGVFWFFQVPIDHVLVSPELVVQSRWVERPIGSDHLPVVVDITFPPGVLPAVDQAAED